MTGGFDLYNAYALVIGISSYKDPNIRKLNYTKADAEGILKILKDPEKVGMKQDNIKILLDEEATLFNIKKAISGWLYKNANKESTVVVYFAGHGGVEEDRLGIEKDNWAKFMLVYDSEIDNLYSTSISNREFNELLATIRSKKLVIFMDCCYSGGVTDNKARDVDVKITDDPYLKLAEGEGRLVIAASQHDQRSFEHDKIGHGIFTYHLIEALSGKADTNNDGYVTVTEVHNYLADTVPKTAMQLAGKVQNPILRGNITKDFILTIDHERLEELDQENRKKKKIDEMSFSAISLNNEGKYSEAINNWKDVLILDSENEVAKEGIRKAEDHKKNKNLDRLFDWFYNGDINDEQYELACRLVESKTDRLCYGDVKVLKLLDGLLSDKISITRFRNDVERIRGTDKAPVIVRKDEKTEIKKQAEDNAEKNSIVELCSNALKFFDKKMYADAIADWEDVLKLDPVNRKAIEGIEEARKIMKELDEKKSQLNELNDSAKQSYTEGKYSDSIKKWKRILSLDSENQEAINGIEKSERALIKNEENNKKITNLNSSAKRLYNNKEFDQAIQKWKEILDLDPKNQEAIDGIEKSNRTLKETEEKDIEIDNLMISAQKLYENLKYNEAIEKWKEVLIIDPQNKIAMDGIQRADKKIIKISNCPNCGYENRRKAKFCANCGNRFCQECGSSNRREAKFCTQCQAGLS